MNKLDRTFARCFSSKEALDALIQLHRVVDNRSSCLHQDLALNPNLSAEQITQLLAVTKQLSPVADSDHLDTGILLASRMDLSVDHIWSILKSGNKDLRHALLNFSGKIWNSNVVLDDVMIEYLISQNWFLQSNPFIRVICNYKESFGISEVSFKKLRSIYNARFPNDPITKTGYPEPGYHPEIVWGAAYSKRDHMIWRVKLVNDFEDYHKYFFNPLAKTPGKYLNYLNDVVVEIKLGYQPALQGLSYAVEEAVSGLSFEFFTLFFSLLPDWQGSINELIQACKSLDSVTVS